MTEQNFPDHYCPCCLSKVDSHGDHWQPCEYEATYGDWVNPRQPLTKPVMLEQKLAKTKEQLKALRKSERALIDAIAECETKLNSSMARA